MKNGVSLMFVILSLFICITGITVIMSENSIKNNLEESVDAALMYTMNNKVSSGCESVFEDKLYELLGSSDGITIEDVRYVESEDGILLAITSKVTREYNNLNYAREYTYKRTLLLDERVYEGW